MDKKVILIDIDDTLNEFGETFVDLYNKEYNDNIHPEDIKGWNFQDYVNTNDNVYDLFKHPGLFTSPKPKVYAEKFLKSLMTDYEVYLITDSPSGTNHFEAKNKPFSNPADDKRYWVNKHFPFIPKEKIIFCTEKWMVRGDLLLDDKEETYLKFKETGRPALLMDANHNKKVITTNRVHNLLEAEKEIRRILN